MRFVTPARPWHIGTLYNHDRTLPPLLLQHLRAEGDLVVGNNEPYAVSDATDYTIPVHGEKRGLISSGIEIRQDLIGDQAGQQQWADRLARILRRIEEMLRKEAAIQRAIQERKSFRLPIDRALPLMRGFCLVLTFNNY